MTTNREKGASFEEKAFGLLQALVVSEQFGFLPDCAKIFTQKAYFSSDRGSDIVFDISIEVTLPGASEPSFLWLWECKNYAKPIPVDDVEEFNSKVLQVAGLNVKGGIISSGALQSGALNYAASRKIAVIRILPDDQVTWIRHHMASRHSPAADDLSTDAIAAITQPHFHAVNQREFAASHGYIFPVVSAMIRHALLTEAADVANSPLGYRLQP